MPSPCTNSSLTPCTASPILDKCNSFKTHFSVNTISCIDNSTNIMVFYEAFSVFCGRDEVSSGAEGIIKNALHTDLVVVVREW